jgi:NodT family efflux transporter outer membrane factor (OMF) lipoprotein
VIAVPIRKYMRGWSALTIVSLAFFLPGCVPPPSYTRPDLQAPVAPAFKEAMAGNTTVTTGSMENKKWWELYDDPQLNALEEQVDVSNQNLKAAAARFQEARAVVHANRSGRSVIVSGGASAAGIHQSENRPIGHSNYDDYVLPVDLSYEADVWRRIDYAVDASAASAQATAADMATIGLSLHAELAMDYFELRGVDAERQLLESIISGYVQALDLTRSRFNGGIASAADVAQAETQIATTRAQSIDVEVQRSQFENAIAVLVGQSASDFNLAMNPMTGTPPAIPAGLPSELVEHRPDIASAERRVASASAQLGVVHAAYFPRIALSIPTGFESGNIAKWLFPTSIMFSAIPSVATTLLDGGRREAVTVETQAAYDESVADYQQAVLSAFRDVETSLAALRILQDEADAEDAAVVSAQHSLDIALIRYKGGITTYLEVITAQNTAASNARTAVQVLRRRMGASVALIKALGGGWNVAELPSGK